MLDLEILHNLLQRLILLNIHLEARSFFALPIVDHRVFC